MSFDNSYRLKSLRSIAQQKYVIGFSRMNKSQLIDALNRRTEEPILTIPGDIFNCIIGYSTIQDKAEMRKVSKTMRIRVQSNLTDIEKKVLKKPTNYFKDVIAKFLKTSDINKMKKMNKFITENFEMYYPASCPEYKNNIVIIIKNFLTVIEYQTVKNNKIQLVLQTMKFTTDRKEFLINHKKFAITVKQKIIEFESEDAICGNERIEMDYYKTRIDNIVSGFSEEQLKNAEDVYNRRRTSVCSCCGRTH